MTRCLCYQNLLYNQFWAHFIYKNRLIGLVGKSVRQWSGRPEFNPRWRHTKDYCYKYSKLHYIYIYIYIYIYKRVIQKASPDLRFVAHLSLLLHLCLTHTKMKTKIWFRCSSFVSGSVLPPQKGSGMILLSWWDLELLKLLSYAYIHTRAHTHTHTQICMCIFTYSIH